MQMVWGEKGGRRELLGKEEESLCRRTFLQYIHAHSVDSKDMGEYANSFPLLFFSCIPLLLPRSPWRRRYKKVSPKQCSQGGFWEAGEKLFWFRSPTVCVVFFLG